MRVKILLLLGSLAIMFQVFLRYDDRQIGFVDIRYDRLTGVVSVKPIVDDEWIRTEIPSMKIAVAHFQRKQLVDSVGIRED